MDKNSSQAPRNTLLRRLRQHANIATLFKAEDQTAETQVPSGRLLEPSSSDFGSPTAIVQAQILPPSSHAGLGLSVPLTPPLQETSQPTRRSTSETKAPSSPVGLPPTAVFSAPEQTQPAPVQQPAEKPPPLWRRLERIVQLHREKEADTSPDLEDTPAELPHTVTPKGDPTPDAKASPATQERRFSKGKIVERSQPDQAPLQKRPAKPKLSRKIEEFSSATQMTQAESPEFKEDHPAPQAELPGHPPQETDPQELSFGEKAHSQDEFRDETPIESPEQPVSEQQLGPVQKSGLEENDSAAAETVISKSQAPKRQEKQTLQPKIDPSSALDSGEALDPVADTSDPLSTIVAQPGGEDKASDSPLGTLPESPSTQDGTTAISEPDLGSAVPLQAAWPVERREPPEAHLKTDHVRIPPEDTATTETELGSQTGHIQRALEDVPSAHPSDSTIEVVTPRRPRPTSAKLPTEPASSPTVIKHKQPEDGGETPTMVQPKGEIKPGSVTPSEHSLVQTEIGPLPSDLWDLIGQSPPQETNTPPTPTVQKTAEEPPGSVPTVVSAGQTDQPTIQRAITQESGQSSQGVDPNILTDPTILRDTPIVETSVSGSVPSAIPGTIQRTAVRSTPASPTQAPTRAPTEPEGAEGGEEEGEEVDIDALAKQVYAALKRRISIEWERHRGRNF